MILNFSDPDRTRMEVRHHPALFVVDACPVFEVWFWHAPFNRWFCMSKSYDIELARGGVVYFDSIEQLKASFRWLKKAA